MIQSLLALCKRLNGIPCVFLMLGFMCGFAARDAIGWFIQVFKDLA